MQGSYQYDPKGGGSHQQYRYNPGSGPQKNGGKNDWGEWVAIAVLFFIPTWITKVVAGIWFVRKLMSMSKQQQERYRQEAWRAAQRVKDEVENVARQGAQAAQEAQAQQESSAGKKAAKAKKSASPKGGRKKAQKEADGSTGLIIGGGIVTGVFALGLVSTLAEMIESLSYGYFFSENLVGVLACAVFLCGGLAMLLSGVGGRRRQERYLNYLAYIGANREVGLAHMAATFGVSVRKLCKDLRRMLTKGILPTGYLDLAEGKLYLTEMGYTAHQEEPPQQAKQEEEEDAILREIRQVNDEIPDETMSRKIDEIEEITGKILKYRKEHPDRADQLRTFLNYYLPTTLKILRAYAQLEAQGIEGENISAAKARIEGMMDQVVSGFEKQLDKLFQDDAMDITSDVKVLENMLKKDGLSDDSITMGL